MNIPVLLTANVIVYCTVTGRERHQGGKVEITACYISNTGKVRKINEDSMLLNDLLVCRANMDVVACAKHSGDKQIYAVADGMGGHQKGETASKTVLDVLQKQYMSAADAGDVSDIIVSAKKELNRVAAEDRSTFGLGTTVTGLFLTDGRAFVFNCGDSRVYRVEGGALRRLTRDHSLVQDLVDSGVITEDEMRSHPQKNIVTSAITGDLREALPEIDVEEIEGLNGSTFLLCSDGLWESMRKENMEACLPLSGDPAQCLFDRAMESGGRDNISVILLKVQKT